MPILSDDLKVEQDRTYTPFEKRRREAMNIRNVHRFGFFQVGMRQHDPLCSFCILPIQGPHMRINGIDYHNECAFKKD